MKVMELNHNNHNSVLSVDLADCGFQQYELLDHFDLFENPHGGLEGDVTQEEKQHLKMLYSGKKHRQSEARFSPAKGSVDIYFCFVQALQYIYVRNYIQKAIVKRVSLMHFPTCMVLVDEYSAIRDQ